MDVRGFLDPDRNSSVRYLLYYFGCVDLIHWPILRLSNLLGSEVDSQRVRFQTFLLISHFCFPCNYDILETKMSCSSLYPKTSFS